MIKSLKLIFTIIGFAIFITKINAQNTVIQGFMNPPKAAKPRVWWHWMNGNITKEGIQKDLDWMSRVGIGGFQNFDANLFTPVVVPKKFVFMTPEWKDAFRFATETADKKGLEMAIAGSPGWSVTGGPWVEPKDAMKKYVYTETRIASGQGFSGKLPQPSDATGKFQNTKIENAGITGGFIGTLPVFYQDAAVIAYRLPNNDQSIQALNPKVTSSGGSFSLKDLTDGDLMNGQLLPPKKAGEEIWIQYEFENPQTIKAFSVAGAYHTGLEDFNGGPENRSLQASDDGVNFREIATVSGSIVPLNTVSFPTEKAKYFRLVYKTMESQPNMFVMLAGGKPEPTKPIGVEVAEFMLYTTDRIDRVEDKAGFTPWKEDTKSFLAKNADAISENDIIDLTKFMLPDGSIKIVAKATDIRNPNAEIALPAGNWIVMRLGYSLTGRQNHPASPEATGLEVDKLDKDAVRKYINTYLDMYKEATNGMMGAKGLQYMVLDSYEAGHMTWTKAFPEEFQKRRGYNISTWLPVLAGRIVRNTESSEKFLWDFRKTIGELIAENHYDIIGEELHKRGMKRYTESHEDKRIYLADGMDVKRYSDIPMAAMWTPGSLAGGDDEEVRSQGDIRESASVANIYGQNIVAAESMTSIQNGYSFHPEKLKRTADLEMASGLNRFVIHTSVHQPLDDKLPGFSLGPFGQYFTRQETWAEVGGKAWMEYLGRSCHLLQQGKNIADILYYYGENQNITWLTRNALPAIPAGYEFDFVNSSALINAIQVKNGQLVAKSGNTYKLLVLDESAKNMTLTVLKKLQQLVNAGAKVAGIKPEQSPSLTDDPSEFEQIVNDIWKNSNVLKGSISEALNILKVSEDVSITKAENKILYRHRKAVIGNQKSGMDIYWLNNRSNKNTEAEVSFRISGKIPELWNAQTGKIEKLSYQIKDGRTIVPLSFESWDAYFIIFKDKSIKNSISIASKTEKEIMKITGEWQVSFQKDRGAPANATFGNLKSYTENADIGIKFFSGTASYTTSFSSPKAQKVILDLGEVKNIAEVFVNGKLQGVVWKKPFKIAINEPLKIGENQLEIKVTNLWVNRLIGDAQPNTTNKITFTTMPFYQASSPLLPSGLMGPVKLLVKE